MCHWFGDGIYISGVGWRFMKLQLAEGLWDWGGECGGKNIKI